MSKDRYHKGPLDYDGKGAQYYKGGFMHGNGCNLHGDCFTCPFDMCRFDDPEGAVGVVRRWRKQEAERLRALGWRREEISAALKMAQLKVDGIGQGGAMKDLPPRITRLQQLVATVREAYMVPGATVTGTAQQLGMDRQKVKGLVTTYGFAAERRVYQARQARALKEEGYSEAEIADRVGINIESVQRRLKLLRGEE